MRNRRIPLALLPLLLIALLSPTTARANAGPPLVLTAGDEQVFLANKNDQIAILSERLTYDIRVQGETAQADVRARYEMSNTTDAPVELPVAFVSSKGRRVPEISFRGEAVPVLEHRAIRYAGRSSYWYEAYDAEKPLNSALFAGIPFSQVLTLMNGGEPTVPEPDPNARDPLSVVQVTLFTLSFAAGETCDMVVSYPEDATAIKERGAFYGYRPAKLQFLYYLEPARYWKDFSDLTIEVKVNTMNARFSLPEFRRTGPTTFKAHYEDLPSGNLVIQVDTGWPERIAIGAILAALAVLLLWRLRRHNLAREAAARQAAERASSDARDADDREG